MPKIIIAYFIIVFNIELGFYLGKSKKQKNISDKANGFLLLTKLNSYVICYILHIFYGNKGCSKIVPPTTYILNMSTTVSPSKS